MRSPQEVAAALESAGYLSETGLATAIFLARSLEQPLLLEGEPGVGKTSSAKAIAAALDAPFIRLQCYEGLGVSEALYEWNYQRQLLALRVSEGHHEVVEQASLFSERFLEERPILRAVRHAGPVPPVLLIDEVDRADDEFEALLLEFLAEGSVTVPELGTFVAVRRPLVILTSNRTRELHDALLRRCLYHWIEFPDVERAAEIARLAVPSATLPVVRAATQVVVGARGMDLERTPGLAEIIDLVAALTALGVEDPTRDDIESAMAAVAKSPEDLAALTSQIVEGA